MTKNNKKKTVIIITVSLLAFVLLACVTIYLLSLGKYEAEDFGFTDIKSSLDADGDGIDDFTDMVEGARAYIATEPIYDGSRYYAGGYPDDGYGVCTDVIWQAFAAAGYSLKDMVDADIAARTDAYFDDDEIPDPNIDFRRVRNLIVFFREHSTSLTTSTANPEDWMPGDIVIYDWHIAICSDVRNAVGLPYIIHHGNIVDGAVEANELLISGRIVGHFRFEPKSED